MIYLLIASRVCAGFFSECDAELTDAGFEHSGNGVYKRSGQGKIVSVSYSSSGDWEVALTGKFRRKEKFSDFDGALEFANSFFK